jgi:hypothetical protein
MFTLTAFVYPIVLAILCVGAGLLVDRASGGFLPRALLGVVGAATLIAVSQLTTYVSSIAPATPYVIVAVALVGFALAWQAAARSAAPTGRASRLPSMLLSWPLAASAVVYVIALAPVLLAGRPTFSSFMALSDSAFHMLGADYLIRHGQDYAHLDLRNSSGLFMNAYYNSSYPSGADTLFGGSAFLLGLPLIWAFQPFTAFMLALAAGPAWLLVRRLGLEQGWGALAAVGVTVPALVYAYELIGSIKEIAALPMILALGVLVTLHRRWLRGPAAGAMPFGLVVAGGVSTLGVGFGAWALASALVLLVVLLAGAAPMPGRSGFRAMSAYPGGAGTAAGSRSGLGFWRLIAVGAFALALAAWPTWSDVSGSVQVTQNIAATGNPGNLRAPLKAVQALGVWLRGSYKLAPSGTAYGLTYALIAVTLLACALGMVHAIRLRERALAGWLVLMLAVWLLVSADSTTWVSAKTLMLTSPAVMVMAWGGVGGLRASSLRWAAPVLAALLLGGAVASDALQYHGSNLAPTARYEELASLNRRFAGRGPVLFTDFDEYSMYELRDLDVGGADFAYPPPALAPIAGGYGRPVDLDLAPPAALRAYPLIITRRDPSASRPPSAYRLAWQGTYYEAWTRRSGAPVAIAHVGLSGPLAAQCAQIGRLAALPAARGTQLIASSPAELVLIPPRRASHPARWGREREGLVLSTPGRLSSGFALPHGGVWELWLQGQLMPAVNIAVDGRSLGSIAGQLAGNSLVPDTMTPLKVRLAAGPHRLSITRGGLSLAPGDGGSAVLDAIFLAPQGAAPVLSSVPAANWRALCGRAHQWVEAASNQPQS